MQNIVMWNGKIQSKSGNWKSKIGEQKNTQQLTKLNTIIVQSLTLVTVVVITITNDN